jgi:hypothetical protein
LFSLNALDPSEIKFLQFICDTGTYQNAWSLIDCAFFKSFGPSLKLVYDLKHLTPNVVTLSIPSTSDNIPTVLLGGAKLSFPKLTHS